MSVQKKNKSRPEEKDPDTKPNALEQASSGIDTEHARDSLNHPEVSTILLRQGDSAFEDKIKGLFLAIYRQYVLKTLHLQIHPNSAVPKTGLRD